MTSTGQNLLFRGTRLASRILVPWSCARAPAIRRSVFLELAVDGDSSLHTWCGFLQRAMQVWTSFQASSFPTPESDKQHPPLGVRLAEFLALLTLRLLPRAAKCFCSSSMHQYSAATFSQAQGVLRRSLRMGGALEPIAKHHTGIRWHHSFQPQRWPPAH